MTGLTAVKTLKTISLTILVLVALYFVIDRVLPYFFKFNIEHYKSYYWPNKWWLVGHLSGGALALLIGPFQLSTPFRNRFIKIHRSLGKLYISGIMIASLSAFYMSFYVAPQVNVSWSISLFVLALVWLASVLMAYRAIMLKQIPQHREWMIRSYIISLGFVLFRFLNESSLVQELMPAFEERGPACLWLSWTVPLFASEMLLQWNKKKIKNRKRPQSDFDNEPVGYNFKP
ncbi:DUF2306 domain-containing protein [Psychroflexus sediminis]|uniref:Uncharacterized membrane protein n=1 Tax=Psychroflexus sediminis TaxID=470826 RepID=A0A1G7X0K6_9FLAO|nr:DUF2306 domain-containing protein [Psychroflexus sediminis]SDG77738.1 Uncharacterized membrane protein [Psychroflexus sediminis]